MTSSQPTKFVAMWSGPRNVSTALMRSFEARGDTFVCDEPLYAYYLAETGLEHPMAREIVEHGEEDWRRVATQLTRAPKDGSAVYYQKHMAHHLLRDIERNWLGELSNALLIRDPRAMLPSLDAKYPNPTLADTGLQQQLELFEELNRFTGTPPPVVDSRDLLTNPAVVLEQLCARLGIEYTDAMLSWPTGPRDTDGVWASHWYANVETTTGFGEWKPREAPVPAHLEPLLEECLPYYETLHAQRLRA